MLNALLETADVLVQNLAPGAATRLGFFCAALCNKYSRLIVCDISGYGSDGPYCDKKAYDLLVQSEAGFLSVTRTEDQPVKAGCSLADISAGMYAYSNILAAVIERGITGKGRRIDISMLEATVEWMSFPLYYTYGDAPPPPRAGAAHATIFPYGPFPTGDGKTVGLGLQYEREWASFRRVVLQQTDLAHDTRFINNPFRNDNREELRRLIVGSFAKLSSDTVIARLDEAKIANARVNTMRDVWQHPQLLARGRWHEVDSPQGRLPALLPPGQDGSARMGPIPSVGQHTEQILMRLGFDAVRIERLRKARVI